MASIDNVLDIEPLVQYVAQNGQADFDFPFPITADTDVVVDVDGTRKQLAAHYTVAGVGDDNGGTVTFGTPLSGGEIVTLYRDVAIERLSDFQTNGPLSSATFNDELDKIFLILQQLERDIGRSLRLPLTSPQQSSELELGAGWRSRFVYVNSDGEFEPASAVTNTPLTQSAVSDVLWPLTEQEELSGLTPADIDTRYQPYNVKRYGAISDGASASPTDNAAAVQKAIDALPATGGEIYFPAGDYVIGSTINLAGRRSVRIYGDSRPTAGSAAATLIRTTQTSGDRVFDCRSTYGVSFDSLMIAHFGTGFTGHIIDYGWSDLSLDSALSYVRDCYIQATSTVASLINLHKTHSIEIDSCHLVGGICALAGGGSDYANRILVRNCEFKHQVVAPIVDPGNITQVWEVVGNTFEPNSAGGAAAIYTTSRITNLIFKANWCGDANSTGYWIDAGAMDCCEIRGNFFSTGAGAIKVGAFNSQTNEIKTNTFADIPIALNIDAALSFTGEFLNNFFYVVSTPIEGTSKFTAGKYATTNSGPTRYAGPLILSSSQANGVGGTVSGCVWSVHTGASGNNGLIVRSAAGQTAYPFLLQDSTGDTYFGVSAAGHIYVKTTSDPSAAPAGAGYLYFRLNGGKVQLCARFPSGAVQVISTEP